ncbi:MAG TPA: universal stress protein [Solirubrobacterales bacterium]|jgi:nucleotide-binding universal stress UspA family protein|nr:universal stress protein [Solirubrobacterales bacterium]
MGPIVFAYDGTDTAAFAIGQASGQLGTARDAIVACVWRPVDVGFEPVAGRRFRCTMASEVERAAQETAAQGADIATQAGFRARPRTIQGAPTYRGLINLAEQHACSLIVIGSHHRTGVLGYLTNSVAAATVSHFRHSVLVIRKPAVAASNVPRSTALPAGR